MQGGDAADSRVEPRAYGCVLQGGRHSRVFLNGALWMGARGRVVLGPRTSFDRPFDRLRARSEIGLGCKGEDGFRLLRGFVAVQREVVVAAVRPLGELVAVVVAARAA